MKIINFGSLNLDHVYSVDRFTSAGETLPANGYGVFAGGKGLNQSVAAARAGAEVYHAGMVGVGGERLAELLRDSGADISLLGRCDEAQGHAIIQVSPSGENCILLFRGSNFAVTETYIDRVLDALPAPGYVMLQNEISCLPYVVDQAAARGYQVVLNASPIDAAVLSLPLEKLTWLMVNEIEGAQLTGESTPDAILDAFAARWPRLSVLLTLGKDGSVCLHEGRRYHQAIFPVQAVDTTAAGDTTSGYFVAALAEGLPIPAALERAAMASAIAVTRPGAAPSIPARAEVEQALKG